MQGFAWKQLAAPRCTPCRKEIMMNLGKFLKNLTVSNALTKPTNL